MAKEKSSEKSEHKKDKKGKKEKRSEKDGVHKSKKDKKEKKAVPAAEVEDSDDAPVTQPLLENLTNGKKEVEKEDVIMEEKAKAAPLLGALVPFANPLADEKVGKKVLKSVKKGILPLPHLVLWSIADTEPLQPRKTNRSSAASKKLSSPSVNPPQPQPLPLLHPPGSLF